MLPTKKGRITPLTVASPQLGMGEIRPSLKGEPSTIAFERSAALAKFGTAGGSFTTFSSMLPPTPMQTSRFLAKVAVGYVAHRLVRHGLDADAVVRDPALDRIRDHARRGGAPIWPVSVRRIYPPNHIWNDEFGRSQKVTEVDVFFDEEEAEYVVLAIFGTELVIPICDPDISGYHRWLANNDDESPLYQGLRAGELRAATEQSNGLPHKGWCDKLLVRRIELGTA